MKIKIVDYTKSKKIACISRKYDDRGAHGGILKKGKQKDCALCQANERRNMRIFRASLTTQKGQDFLFSPHILSKGA